MFGAIVVDRGASGDVVVWVVFIIGVVVDGATIDVDVDVVDVDSDGGVGSV